MTSLAVLLALSAPAEALTLEASPVVPGTELVLTLTDAVPGETLHVGRAQGPGAGPCPAATPGTCLDIAGGATLLGTATGEATLSLTVPATAPTGLDVAFQALAMRSGTDAVTSNVITTTTRAIALHDSPLGWMGGTDAPLTWLASPALAGPSLDLWDGLGPVAPVGTVLGGWQAGTHTVGLHPPGDYPLVATPAGGAPVVLATVSMARLVGFYWDGTQEWIAAIDLQQGTALDLGVVDDLAWWSAQTVYDPDDQVIHIEGTTQVGDDWLYTMDALSGAFVGKVPLTVPLQGVERLSSGLLVSFSWNGTEEVMHHIDPDTGAVSDVGVVGDLQFWSGQTVYDETTDVVWVAGIDSAGDDVLWGMDGSDGTLLYTTPLLGELGTGIQLAADGTLRTCRWNGTAEELVATDPMVGLPTPIGLVGDLQFWSGETIHHPSTDRMFVWGIDSAGTDRMWTLDATTGDLLDTTAVAQPLGGLVLTD